MGVRWMASKLEGEAQCAQLEKRGLVHGCITRDFDYILFGGNNLYQVRLDDWNYVFVFPVWYKLWKPTERKCVEVLGIVLIIPRLYVS